VRSGTRPRPSRRSCHPRCPSSDRDRTHPVQQRETGQRGVCGRVRRVAPRESGAHTTRFCGRQKAEQASVREQQLTSVKRRSSSSGTVSSRLFRSLRLDDPVRSVLSSAQTSVLASRFPRLFVSTSSAIQLVTVAPSTCSYGSASRGGCVGGPVVPWSTGGVWGPPSGHLADQTRPSSDRRPDNPGPMAR